MSHPIDMRYVWQIHPTASIDASPFAGWRSFYANTY
jgi:hypothetical protein